VVDTSKQAYLDFTKRQPPLHASKLLALIRFIESEFPCLERVIAWNIPHFRLGAEYVLGIDVLKNALWVHPFQHEVLSLFADRLAGYHVTKRSFQLPLKDDFDQALLRDLLGACLTRLKE
jgi:uncharacterized protein YdhG (YjbR/CyaY superfamily)